MKRREALRNTAFLAGCGLSVGTISAIVSGCKQTPSEYAETFLGGDYVSLLAEMVETIIPTTDTPGAKAAGVHLHLDNAVKYFTEEEQGQFKGVLDMITESGFMSQSQEEREATLLSLDKEEDGVNPYEILRGLTCHGYFTSEIGGKQALKYDPIPGAWNPCVDLSEVGKAWSLS